MSDSYTVAGITAYIRDLIDQDPPLRDIWVRGEVSNMKAAASGHWYFTLKDRDAQLKCVMFRSQAEKQAIEPRDGEEMRVHGRVSVYEARGEYQLYADQLQPAGGIGALYLRFEELKAQLDAEGLFEPSRKRPLPVFPLRIGVVTSQDAAALRDVCNVLGRRFPLAEVILSPSLVQGSEAPALIVRAIERLNAHGAVDVMLVTRGGGSIEDLWAFNDERVARAIAASEIPVISGVGHETDFTIADFVADYRAPTPSAAAEVATPDLGDYVLALGQIGQTLREASARFIAQQRERLHLAQRLFSQDRSLRRIAEQRVRVDDLRESIEREQGRQLQMLRERLEAQQAALASADPQQLLTRGYAIVRRSEDGQIITQERDAPAGTGITIRLRDGEIAARVEDKDSHGQYKRTLF